MTLGVYTAKCPVGDTRLYMADKKSVTGFDDTWYFVAEDDYLSYIAAVKGIAEEYYNKSTIYNAAMTLGDR